MCIAREDIITEVETAIPHLTSEDAEEICLKIWKILGKAKLPMAYFSAGEANAHQQLKSDKDIIILRTDKCNATINMNNEHYSSKIEVLLDDDQYPNVLVSGHYWLNSTTSSATMITEIYSCASKFLPDVNIPSFYLEWNSKQNESAATGIIALANNSLHRYGVLWAYAIDTTVLKHKCWLRYVDDSFVIWPYGSTELKWLLDHKRSHRHPIFYGNWGKCSNCFSVCSQSTKKRYNWPYVIQEETTSRPIPTRRVRSSSLTKRASPNWNICNKETKNK